MARKTHLRRAGMLGGATLCLLVSCVTGIASNAPAAASGTPFPPDPAGSGGRTPPRRIDGTMGMTGMPGGPEPDRSWWQAITAELAREEYAASPSASGLQAPNRAQNLRTAFGEEGIAVVPRTGKDAAPAWRFAWETTGLGRPGRMREIGPASPLSQGGRVVYRRDGWNEWYENSEQGLEQGFTVERRPEGEGRLRIAGRIAGELAPRARANGSVDFIEDHGACAIRYGEPHARDARGRELPAELQVSEAALAIVVDDRGAEYPLTIDPLMTSPAWAAEGDQAIASFGLSVATAGDVNGDGFSDVIVGAYLYDDGETDEGRAFLYYGSPGGLGLTPAWTAEGNQVQAKFGFSVATAGDVNGDGFSDVIVGAIGYDNGQTDEGRAFVYLGSPGGLASTADWTAESDQAGASFGLPVAAAGDVNGDGFSDVIIGASLYDNGQTDEGRAFLYLGSPGGLSPTAAWTAEGDQASAYFGTSLGTAGDVNGDGYGDVIVGAYNYSNGEAGEGRAFVYLGGPGGLSPTAVWTAESDQANANLGWSVSTAGDVNGDGYADVIVGVFRYDDGEINEGCAFLYQGSAAGPSSFPNWAAQSDQTGAQFGSLVATAGDVNGDGYADVIVGAPRYDGGQTDEGRVYLYLGSGRGLAGGPSWTAESDQAGALFGYSAATAGDVNGDGYSDVIVGAYQYDDGELDEGAAFLYLGGGDSLSPLLAWVGLGGGMNIHFGTSVASAGDVNGDGYSDVLVGVPGYDNGFLDAGRVLLYEGSAAGLAAEPSWSAEGDQEFAAFGRSEATAGDVNGDGYSDVIIGVPQHGSDYASGRAVVYLGSAAGLAATPAWIVDSDQAGAVFGWSVATAGDVNGDGYSDVIVGAYLYDHGQSDEGRAFVYLGSAAGLAATPAWTAESDIDDSRFGYSVATAGDVNGDGYSDVIVGAETFNNGQDVRGRVFVYLGSPAGPAPIEAWIAEDDRAGTRFGHSVATAGDVNGDGYSDVIVGAPFYYDGEDYEGCVFVYEGSPMGLEAAPAWSLESNQAGAQFGSSVAAAGDVNGDGYSDIIIGASYYDHAEVDEGWAFVFHGSAAGPTVPAAWSAQSNQAGAELGSSVATAGDVNGDGYSDVIVGVPFFDSSQQDEGAAFVYYGNGGDGIDRLAGQRRTDDSAWIPPLGRSDSGSAFRLAVLGRTAMGRGRVGLQYEVRPFGVLFDGSGAVTGGFFDTGTPVPETGSAVPFSELVGGLAPETLYHWRLRILSDSPFVPHTPWFTLTYNGSAEADFRTGEAPAGIGTAGVPGTGLLLSTSGPNPFVRSTRIGYTLPRPGRARLAIYDAAGRERAVLVDGEQAAGPQQVSWDGRQTDGGRLPPGVYFARLAMGGQAASEKLVLGR